VAAAVGQATAPRRLPLAKPESEANLLPVSKKIAACGIKQRTHKRLEKTGTPTKDKTQPAGTSRGGGVLEPQAPSTSSSSHQVFLRAGNKPKTKKLAQIYLLRKRLAAQNSRVLDLTDNNIRNIHRQGHAPASRIIKFLQYTLGDVSEDQKEAWTALKKRINDICAECSECLASKRPNTGRSPSAGLRTYSGFNAYVQLDTLYFEERYKVLVCSCAGTGLVRYLFMSFDSTAEHAALTFVLGWVAIFGPPRKIVWADMGPEFSGDDFITTLDALGIPQGKGAARQSQSKGKIENKNRILRQALRRTHAHRSLTLQEVPLVLASMENDANNTIISPTCGAATHRVFGQSTAFLRNALSDSAATASACTENKLIVLLEEAREEFRRVTQDRQLRRLMHSTPPPACDTAEVGDLVFYLRGFEWLGPAVVCSVVPSDEGTVRYYVLDRAGQLIHASRFHVKIFKKIEEAIHDPDVIVHVEEKVAQPETSPRERSSSPTFRGAVPYSVHDPSQAPSARLLGAPGTRKGVGAEAIGVCPGCVNDHRRHRPGCPRARGAPERSPTPRRRKRSAPPTAGRAKTPEPETSPEPSKAPETEPAQPRVASTPVEPKVLAPLRKASPKKRETRKARPRTRSTPVKFPPKKRAQASPPVSPEPAPAQPPASSSTQAGKQAKATVARRRSPSQAQEGIKVGDNVSFVDALMRRTEGTVRGRKANGLLTVETIKGTTVKPHVSNVRKLRHVRTVSAKIFTTLTDSTSRDNAFLKAREQLTEASEITRICAAHDVHEEKLVHSFYTHLEAAESDPVVSQVWPKTESDSDDESDEEEPQSDAAAASESVSIATFPEKAILKQEFDAFCKRISRISPKFLKSSDAMGISFENLPEFMQDIAYAKAIKDFQGRWLEPETLGHWHTLRRAAAKPEYKGPKIIVFDATTVEKATVDEGTLNDYFGGLRGKIRITPRGFRQKGVSKKETAAPTAHAISFRLAEFIGLKRRLKKIKIDFLSAFFKHRIPIERDKERMCLVLPKRMQNGREGQERLVRELLYEVPGNKRTSLLWYQTLARILLLLKFQRSRIDPCMFVLHSCQGKLIKVECLIVLHVDDGVAYATSEAERFLHAGFQQHNLKTRLYQIVDRGVATEVIGKTWLEKDEGTYVHQEPFIQNKVELVQTAHVPRPRRARAQATLGPSVAPPALALDSIPADVAGNFSIQLAE